MRLSARGLAIYHMRNFGPSLITVPYISAPYPSTPSSGPGFITGLPAYFLGASSVSFRLSRQGMETSSRGNRTISPEGGAFPEVASAMRSLDASGRTASNGSKADGRRIRIFIDLPPEPASPDGSIEFRHRTLGDAAVRGCFTSAGVARP